MNKREAPATSAATSASGIAALLLLSAWCVPAVGSSSVPIQSDQAENTLPAIEISAATSRPAARAEPDLTENLDDKDASIHADRPAIPEATNKLLIEEIEDIGASEDGAFRFSKNPGVAARLPGVSETALPRFRHHMYRTDI